MLLQKANRLRRRLKYAWQDFRVAQMYARAGVRTRSPTAHERGLLLTVEDLIKTGYSLEFDKNLERWIARQYPDGATEIRYSYEPLDALPGRLRFMLTTRIERTTSSANAVELFNGAIDWSAAGAATEGGRFVFKGNLQS